ncbi:M24 family metallopeptidase [Microbacterium sp. NPDC089696]|uniref:M24 family metallopeptidase n=1 Tax=Microbacterium sp. NPDC089696 TaxID=3364199 RepID=UPI0037FCB272
MSIFTESEILRRQSLVAADLAAKDVDLAIFTSSDNVYYTSGVPLLSEWGRPMWSVLFPDSRSVVIGAEIEAETMERNAPASKVLPFGDEGNVIDLALERLFSEIPAEVRVGRVGIEMGCLSVSVFEKIRARFSEAEFVDVGPVAAAARIIKSEEESVILNVAAEIAKIGANAYLEALTPGNTELAVAGHARAAMDKALGALYPEGATSSYVYAQFGDHSLSPHLHATGRRLQRGDVVALNVFPVVWGYCIELERTYVYGPRTDRQDSMLDILERSFTLGKELYLPGKRFDELHADCTAVLAEDGLDKYVRHGTGHAHGIMVGSASREELGEIRKYNHGTVQTGMFNSIEPGFYIPGEGGFRHSDVMQATSESATCITEFPVRLDL